jgi:hypothetical protein
MAAASEARPVLPGMINSAITQRAAGSSCYFSSSGALRTLRAFTYNSLNQLTSAVKGSTAAYFWYDGLGRICTRQINGGTGVRFQVWAGWDMVEDYTYPSHTLGSVYLQGEDIDEMVSITTGGQKYYLYQDGTGTRC